MSADTLAALASAVAPPGLEERPEVRPVAHPREATHLAVPDSERPRFVIPLGPPSAAAASCLAYNALRSPATRVARAAVAAAMRVGLGGTVAGDRVALDLPGGLAGHLAGLLGVEHVYWAAGCGTLDPYWKPVLQLFGPDGRPLGFAKVGRTPLTAGMVLTEADALEAVAAGPPRAFSAPGLLARTSFKGAPAVVTAPMPLGVRRPPQRWALPPTVTAEIAEIDGTVTTTPLLDTPWWSTLVGAVGAARPRDRVRLADLLGRAADGVGSVPLRIGRWHGDWVRWNVAVERGSSRLWVWDWEYSAAGVPVGLDVLHHHFQEAFVREGRSLHTAADVALWHSGPGWRQLGVVAVGPVLALVHALELVRRAIALDAEDAAGNATPAALALAEDRLVGRVVHGSITGPATRSSSERTGAGRDAGDLLGTG